jgi:hypothetical protein
MNSVEYKQLVTDCGYTLNANAVSDCDTCHGTGVEIIGYYGNGESDTCECVE